MFLLYMSSPHILINLQHVDLFFLTLETPASNAGSPFLSALVHVRKAIMGVEWASD